LKQFYIILKLTVWLTRFDTFFIVSARCCW
jgi:hypothetical protein